jgi:hypothetical protein
VSRVGSQHHWLVRPAELSPYELGIGSGQGWNYCFHPEDP